MLRPTSYPLYAIMAWGCAGPASPDLDPPAAVVGQAARPGPRASDSGAIPSLYQPAPDDDEPDPASSSPSPPAAISDAAGSAVDLMPRPAKADAGAPTPPPLVTGGAVPPCKFLLCESFEGVVEGGLPSRTAWTRIGSGMKVESGAAARGTKALHLKTAAGSFERVFLQTTQVFPRLATEMYGRLFLRVDKRPRQFNHWDFVEARASADGDGTVVRYGAIATAKEDHWFLFNMDKQGGGETSKSDSTRPIIPEKTWMCLEWRFNAQKNEAQFWWNGNERPKVRYANDKGDTFPFPTWKAVAIGYAHYQPIDEGYDLWIDEIALHDQKIGCD